MRTLLQNRDLKTLLGGVAIATAAGLLLGGAIKPNVNALVLGGPQILMPTGASHQVQERAEVGVARYDGRVPEYVIGTDWIRPPALQVAAVHEEDRPAQGDVIAYESPDEPQPAHATRVSYPEPQREPVSFPSDRGGVVYETDLPAPPAPPGDGDAG